MYKYFDLSKGRIGIERLFDDFLDESGRTSEKIMQRELNLQMFDIEKLENAGYIQLYLSNGLDGSAIYSVK